MYQTFRPVTLDPKSIMTGSNHIYFMSRRWPNGQKACKNKENLFSSVKFLKINTWEYPATLLPLKVNYAIFKQPKLLYWLTLVARLNLDRRCTSTTEYLMQHLTIMKFNLPSKQLVNRMQRKLKPITMTDSRSFLTSTFKVMNNERRRNLKSSLIETYKFY